MIENPFKKVLFGNIECETMDAPGRIAAVKLFDETQLRAALQVKRLQKSVLKVVEGRLRKINKSQQKVM